MGGLLGVLLLGMLIDHRRYREVPIPPGFTGRANARRRPGPS